MMSTNDVQVRISVPPGYLNERGKALLVESLAPAIEAQVSDEQESAFGLVETLLIGFAFVTLGALRKFVDGFSEEFGKGVAHRIIAPATETDKHGSVSVPEAIHIEITVKKPRMVGNVELDWPMSEQELSSAIQLGAKDVLRRLEEAD